MKFSIIINTHNQPKYITECIESCRKQNYINYEIIVVDTSQTPSIQNRKFKKFKYFHIKEKYKKYPVLNQMYQIYYGFKKSKGEFLCFLDGDDKFSKDKLKKLANIIENKKTCLIQDVPTIFSRSFKKNSNIKKYKSNFFFKKIIIDWPQIFGTSTITCRKDILKIFFKLGKPFSCEYLAIDVKLVIFVEYFYNIKNKLHEITFKRKHGKNLDDTYSNFFSKSFWIRRNMQHHYKLLITKRRTYNLDYFITKVVNLFL